jgi:hypothetical protein
MDNKQRNRYQSKCVFIRNSMKKNREGKGTG